MSRTKGDSRRSRHEIPHGNSHNRRRFLRLCGGTALAITVNSIVLGVPGIAYAQRFSSLSGSDATTLIAFVQRLFPHPKVGDAPYVQVVAEIDQKMNSDKKYADTIRSGLARLNGAQRKKFVDLTPDAQERVITRAQGSPFFKVVRKASQNGLYNNPIIWSDIGFEGESYSKGGYLYRGFNDLAWLPDPPSNISPPVAQ
ncbi:gluconate 2-dehydrogenase subunit 3 family protein [Caballeronia sp. 15711]|uniref:gluconate 2-dehydrogenase subunit 3 family protein n=1 Tax=Caballeronia sp. 15711 TaxID=3391029 RepID=UPI0039E5F0FC